MVFDFALMIVLGIIQGFLKNDGVGRGSAQSILSNHSFKFRARDQTVVPNTLAKINEFLLKLKEFISFFDNSLNPIS